MKNERYQWAGIDAFQTMPLNQAHLNERKAEKYIEKQKWDEASACFETASRCILKAMEKTSLPKVLQSLQLQFDNYIHQKHIIEIKKSELSSQRSNTFDETEHHVSNNKKVLLDGKEEVCSLPTSKILNYEILSDTNTREPDSLLQFLNPLTTGKANQRKYPKAAPDRLEELQIQNQNLSCLVEKLMLKTEKLQMDNNDLLTKNFLLEEELLSLKAELKGLKCDQSQDGQHCSLMPNVFTDIDDTHHGKDFSEKGFFDFEDHLVQELDIAMQENDFKPAINENNNSLKSHIDKLIEPTEKNEVKSIEFEDWQ
uniref:Uncharacterized protein LOC100175435 n=1 Tax=Phallusia mammillata TaxID=59560 RepID=A0A6F9DGH6_9ASCI|nr:uncharacterized protein LOC100175435 [Phallusia mammillata]